MRCSFDNLSDISSSELVSCTRAGPDDGKAELQRREAKRKDEANACTYLWRDGGVSAMSLVFQRSRCLLSGCCCIPDGGARPWVID